MHQSCSLSQDRKKNSCVGQGIHMVLHVLILSQELTFRQFSIVWLYQFLRDRFFVIPQFLGNFLRDFLGRESVPHYQFSTN